jgi:flagellar basal body-associated protein FliL
MKKIVLGALLVLLLTIGFGVYYLLSHLDSIVKAAIERYGSQATATTVKVDKVQIKLTDGSGAIRGLTVANPRGFDAPYAFLLGEISTQIYLESLSRDILTIDHIIVRRPEVFFELNSAGDNNLTAIKMNLSKGQSKTSGASTQKTDTEPKLIIRKLLLEGGNVQASVVPLNKSYSLVLPKIEMLNLGGNNGAKPDQIAEQVLQRLADQAMAEIKNKGLDHYKDKLQDEVNKRLENEKEKLNEKFGDKLKGTLDY